MNLIFILNVGICSMNFVKCVQSFVNTLNENRERFLCELTDVEYCPAEYKRGNTPPETGWMPYTPDLPLRGFDGHFWLRASFTTPSVREEESVIYSAKFYDVKFNSGLDEVGLTKSFHIIQSGWEDY